MLYGGADVLHLESNALPGFDLVTRTYCSILEPLLKNQTLRLFDSHAGRSVKISNAISRTIEQRILSATVSVSLELFLSALSALCSLITVKSCWWIVYDCIGVHTLLSGSLLTT